MNDKKCKDCGIFLTTENFLESNKKKRFYVCTKCANLRCKKWRQTNPDKVAASRNKHKDENRRRVREYVRHNILNTRDEKGNPIRIKVSKRKHTLMCELCKKEIKITGYHHWDDDNPRWGIWVCGECHKFCEAVERGITVEKYIELKKKVEIGDM